MEAGGWAWSESGAYKGDLLSRRRYGHEHDDVGISSLNPNATYQVYATWMPNRMGDELSIYHL